MKDEILQKTYPPLKLAEVGKSYQHENIMNKENNVKDNWKSQGICDNI